MKILAKIVGWFVTVAVIAAASVVAIFFAGGHDPTSACGSYDADLRYNLPEVADEDNAFITFIEAFSNLYTVAYDYNTNSVPVVELLKNPEPVEKTVSDSRFIEVYGRGVTNSSTFAEICTDPNSPSRADHILADNQKFFSAIREVIRKKGWRNIWPPDVTMFSDMPRTPHNELLRTGRLYSLKIQRELELEKWDAAADSIETLFAFGGISSANPDSIHCALIGHAVKSFALAKIYNCAMREKFPKEKLGRFARLVAADNVKAGQGTEAIKAEYQALSHTVRTMSREKFIERYDNALYAENQIRYMFYGKTEPKWTDRVSRFFFHTLFRCPGYLDYALCRRTTLNNLAITARMALNDELNETALRDNRSSIFTRGGIGRNWVSGFANSLRFFNESSLGYRFCIIRNRLVLAAAKWRLDHDNAQLPSLEILVPNYIESVPQDPYSKNGGTLRYHSGTGVVWSVGKDGNFDFEKMLENGKCQIDSILLREAAFRLFSAP
ncbi:MAG: hypothetical protein IJU44_00270 [Kiritimatiellae bacterium]|nr:hypothetical protein [Kiritimatiellia bacterium]